MKFSASALLISGLTVFCAGAYAQTPAQPPANPLDTVPENMPFNQPYGAPIAAGPAMKLIAEAEAEAKKHNWAMNIAVVDSGGNLVAFERMDGAQLASIAIAQHKARSSVKFRRETKVFEDAIQKGGFNYVATLDDIVASRGGFPLIEDGKIVGAIGCSGGTGSQDAVVCGAAAAMMK
ncbi:MAG TPA: heme-binding protein [Rhodospirillaceae bacterium]|nr:heme-binding protein [Rhodospirillaceae bacterium]